MTFDGWSNKGLLEVSPSSCPLCVYRLVSDFHTTATSITGVFHSIFKVRIGYVQLMEDFVVIVTMLFVRGILN